MTTLPPAVPVTSVSAIREWELLMRQIGALAEQALDLAQGRAERIYLVNDLAAAIASTPHGEPVGDSTYTREGAKAARAFIEWFLTGANQELVVDTIQDGDEIREIRLTPLMILSKKP